MLKSFVDADGRCGKCGGTLQTTDEIRTDNSIVTCSVCGIEIGTYGDVHAKMRDAAFAAARDIATSALDDFRKSFRAVKVKI